MFKNKRCLEKDNYKCKRLTVAKMHLQHLIGREIKDTMQKQKLDISTKG